VETCLHYTIARCGATNAKVEGYTNGQGKALFSQASGGRAAMWLAAPWNWLKFVLVPRVSRSGDRGWLSPEMAARGTWVKFKKPRKLVEEEHGAGGARTP